MDEIQRLVITLEVTREPPSFSDYKTAIRVTCRPAAGAKFGAATELTVKTLVTAAVEMILDTFPEDWLQYSTESKKSTVQEIIAELIKDHLTHLDLTEGVSNE